MKRDPSCRSPGQLGAGIKKKDRQVVRITDLVVTRSWNVWNVSSARSLRGEVGDTEHVGRSVENLWERGTVWN